MIGEVYEVQPVGEMYGCRTACVNHSQQVRCVKATALVMVKTWREKKEKNRELQQL